MKPFTANYKTSLCNLLYQCNHPGIGLSTVFVSHTSKNKFVDVVNALENHFADEIDTVIWFSAFSMDHHSQSEEDLAEILQELIGQIGHTVLMFTSWRNPTPLKRALCLLELYSSLVREAKVEIALSKNEKVELIDNLQNDTNNTMMTLKSLIDISTSECSSLQDKDMIMAHANYLATKTRQYCDAWLHSLSTKACVKKLNHCLKNALKCM